MKKVRINVPNFKRKINPTKFANWLFSIEEYFDWYDMDNDQKVKFARMKLVSFAKIWWISIEEDIKKMRYP